MRTIFTTGQVAKICKVAPRTVSKWFDSGRLGGYKIPGSQDRRIPREKLIQFLREHGMPLDGLDETGIAKVLLVGVDPLIESRLSEEMTDEQHTFSSAGNMFDAGMQMGAVHPDCVVIDFATNRNEAVMIAQNLRRNPDYSGKILIALVSDEDNQSTFDRGMFNEIFRKPFDCALLAARIRTLTSPRKKLA